MTLARGLSTELQHLFRFNKMTTYSKYFSNVPSTFLFLSLFYVLFTPFYRTVDLVRIWTQIVGVEGENFDHLTTTRYGLLSILPSVWPDWRFLYNFGLFLILTSAHTDSLHERFLDYNLSEKLKITTKHLGVLWS